MKRRSLLKGLLAAGAVAPGFRLPLVHSSDYRGKLFVFVQGRRRVGPHELLRPQGQHSGRARHQPLGRGRRSTPGRQHPLCALCPQFGVLREVPPPDARHQRGGCADELPHRGHRAQLERTQLRGLSDDDRAPRCALRAGPAGSLPELRRILRNRRRYPLHAHRQRGLDARNRLPGGGHVRRAVLVGGGTVPGRDGGTARVRGDAVARRRAPPRVLPLRVRSRGPEGVRGCNSSRGRVGDGREIHGAKPHLPEHVAPAGTARGARVRVRGGGERGPSGWGGSTRTRTTIRTTSGFSATSPMPSTTSGITPKSTASPIAWWW